MCKSRAESGIPTQFAGRNFRSRLEAKWAAFFTLARWDWEYEPFDLDGYIPDFIIHDRDGVPILVEVKPIVGIYDTRIKEIDRRLQQWNGNVLVLSYFLPRGPSGVCLGWLRENGEWKLAEFADEQSSIAAGKLWREAGNQVQWQPTK